MSEGARSSVSGQTIEDVAEIVMMEDMFGRWSAAIMFTDGSGRQTKSWGSETECYEALSQRFPDIPITNE